MDGLFHRPGQEFFGGISDVLSNSGSIPTELIGKAVGATLNRYRGPVPGVAAIVLSLFCAFLILTLRPAPASAAPAAVIRNAVVLIAKRNPGNDQHISVGTAFHVGGGWFRTAAHVVRAQMPKRYEGKGFDEWALYQSDEFGNPERYLSAFVIACVDRRYVHDPDGAVLPYDSALVKINGGSSLEETLQVSRSRARVGDAVSVWGFPEGSILFESRARVTRVSERWIEIREAVGSPVIGGHSGSPVVNESGEVVGVMVATVRGVSQHGLALPISDAESGCPKP